MNEENDNSCIICGGETYTLEDAEIKVRYNVCKSCGFTYKLPQYHVDQVKEKSLYDNHQNTMENEGYVNMFIRFLEECVDPYVKGGKALDFGSGPGPVLYELLKQRGFRASHYDPYYHVDHDVFDSCYDLITSTEVFEHLSSPNKTIRNLSYLLEDGGILAVMTSLRPTSDEAFLKWWYRRDQTHIGFFTLKAFEALIQPLRLKCIYTNEKNYFVFRKEFSR